jgi:hypothetical protein
MISFITSSIQSLELFGFTFSIVLDLVIMYCKLAHVHNMFSTMQ